MNTQINLNADLGEWVDGRPTGDDPQMLTLVNSANIACGFHASDPAHIAVTLAQAMAHEVELGAHPSFDDKPGFGRQRMQLAPDDLRALLIYQIGALSAMAKAAGGHLSHVKPHGALSNMACVDADMALVVAEAIASCSEDLILLAPACSELALAGQTRGLRTALEIYADRRYEPDGQLVSRQQPHALIHEPQACVEHVLAMLQAGGILSAGDHFLPTEIHSVCVHGDDPHAVSTAQALQLALREHGFELCGLDELV